MGDVPPRVYVALGLQLLQGAYRVCVVGVYDTESDASAALDRMGFARHLRNVIATFKGVPHAIPSFRIDV